MAEYFITNTEYGKVRGEKITSAVGIPYIRFLGIPYAKPPVGELRFQNPIKSSPWEGVYDALTEPSPCAGINNYLKKYVGSDDCLYMNVYTKDLNPKKKHATIVYIHGGGFRSGSCTLYSYSPDFFLMSDVVLVIFNHRIGPLGFANFHDKSLNIPGNVSMKDQQMAMRFVRDNISNFGGDPDNITLMGHSSGANCVALHCIAESSKGLFHKAVVMAGSALGRESDSLQLNWTKRLAEKLGFGGNLENDKEVLNFLNRVDVIEMAEAADAIKTKEEMEKYNFIFNFAPHRELYPTESAFLLEPPINLLRKAWSNNIDMIIGGNKDEGLSLNKDTFDGCVPVDLYEKHSNLKDLSEKVQEFYESKYSDKEDAKLKAGGDLFVWTNAIRTIKARLSSGGSGKTFLYKFSVDSPTQNHYRNRYLGLGSKGVVHADELAYLWKNEYSDVPLKDSIEFQSIKRFVSIFTSFAMSGNPNNPEIKDAEWKPVGEEPYEALIVDEQLEFQELDEAKTVFDLWEGLYKQAGAKFC